MPVFLFSRPLQKHFVTHSRFSHAYLIYLVYWVAILAPPILLVALCPIDPGYAVKITKPALKYTGLYFVSLNDMEASAIYPMDGISVTVSEQDTDGDGFANAYDISLSATTISNVNSIFLALEFEKAPACAVIARIAFQTSMPSSRVSAQFDISLDPHAGRTACEDMQSALARPGARGLSKLAAMSSPVLTRETGFGPIWESVPSSKTFVGRLTLEVQRAISFAEPTVGDKIRANSIYFVAVFAMIWLLMSTILNGLLTSGLVRLRFITDIDVSNKK
jgi:hypothetical protein